MSTPTSPPMSLVELSRARQVAVDAAEAAGELLRSRAAGPLNARAKRSSGDAVTDLDVAAEALILERLRRVYPDHRMIAEESGITGDEDSGLVWLVDPLDGTNNIAIGMPVYAVGIALCVRSEPLLGVVHDPVSTRTWSAIGGAGAFGPEGTRLRIAPEPRPGRAERPVLAWTQGHDVVRGDPRLHALKAAVEGMSQRMLQLWAPLVGWVMLARGDIDGIVGYQAELVDLPAGALIAREAGAEIRGLDGGPYDLGLDLPPAERCFVAARAGMVGRLLETAGNALATPLAAAGAAG
jgi:myo-inositol-1(or 4)-monophosphatase